MNIIFDKKAVSLFTEYAKIVTIYKTNATVT